MPIFGQAFLFTGKTIFFSALDWGMGHVTRSLPLVRDLAIQNTVILGVTKTQKAFYDQHLPGLEQVPMPSYGITYSRFFPAWMAVLRKVPRLISIIREERALVKELVTTRMIDLIISDNRYGVRSGKVRSVIICHQLKLVMPFFNSIVNKIHRRMICRFSEVWVPDYADREKRLGGELSDASGLKIKNRYMGPLSALDDDRRQHEVVFDYLFLLSGPEPQRTLLEKKLLKAMEGKNKNVALVRGTNARDAKKINVGLYRNLSSGEELVNLVRSSAVVVCRSGYSTLMDLHVLGKKEMLLIPTPGQPEQEYLAQYWKERFGARVIEQKELSYAALAGD